ncbi:MAG: transglycosylase domain-containing protein, partial [Pseudomonadota bacterium]
MKRLFALCLLAAGAAHAVPTPAEVRASYRASEAVLLDRHGEPLDALRIDMKARRLPWVALSDMSASLPIAVMQAEDQRFLQHSGVDYAAIGRAALDNLFRTKARGASTITMQLAGLLDPALQAGASGRTLGQKWNQARAAQELEAGWTKQQILEAYLNLAPFRGEVRGVAASSRTLFGKAPSGLNRTEAIILASLLRAPMATQRVLTRRACGLARELKFDAPCSAIDWEVAKALSHPAALVVLTPAPQVAQKLLKVGNVTSTLDGDLQRFAQSALRQQLLALRERNVRDGAIIVLDNDSGEILAYVGNAGNSEVDGVMALRQAGSTLKPFLYELAIERKLITAASVLDDSPVDIPTAAGMYVPQNYDKEFKGKVSTRTSLASSLNVPAVRTLLMTGLDRFYNRLREVGITTLDQPSEYYGYSLALGSAEVNLLELANAYRVLASGGLAGQATLQAHATPRRRVLDQGAAFIVGDILSDRAARSLT